jgi:hypothetical protein
MLAFSLLANRCCRARLMQQTRAINGLRERISIHIAQKNPAM